MLLVRELGKNDCMCIFGALGFLLGVLRVMLEPFGVFFWLSLTFVSVSRLLASPT